MTEPIYSYKKGQGWVVTIDNFTINYRGQLYRVERRVPKEGELYGAFAILDRPNGVTDKDISEEVNDGCIWVNSNSNNRDPDIYHYFTLVPL